MLASLAVSSPTESTLPLAHTNSPVRTTAIVLGVYIYGIEKHHYDHALHEYHENDNNPPERIFYEYNVRSIPARLWSITDTTFYEQNIRKKGFPWGDGSKSIFHNDVVNYPASP